MSPVNPGLRLSAPRLDPPPETIAISTPSGPVVGILDSHVPSAPYFSITGLPFAEPPHPLQPAVPRSLWTAPLECFSPGLAVPQKESTGLGKILGVIIPEGADIGKSGPDCLNLNILAPSPPSLLSKAPVQIWLHGGSNVMCSNKGDFGGFSNTASSTFVSRGLVCVSLNYRTGMHGFLHIKETGATNLALRDVILGLEWVRDHSKFHPNP